MNLISITMFITICLVFVMVVGLVFLIGFDKEKIGNRFFKVGVVGAIVGVGVLLLETVLKMGGAL